MTKDSFYNVLQWVMWLIYLNILWFLFTMIGLVLFGVFPATVSLFAVIRKLFLKEDLSVTKTFIQIYKEEFFKANGIGMILVLVAYILYMDFLFLDKIHAGLFTIFQIGLIIVSILYFITLIYIFPVYVHYQLKFIDYFKHALLIGVFSLLTNLIIIISFVCLYFLYTWIPGFIPIFGLSLASFILTVSVMLAFNRFEKRQQKLNGIESLQE